MAQASQTPLISSLISLSTPVADRLNAVPSSSKEHSCLLRELDSCVECLSKIESVFGEAEARRASHETTLLRTDIWEPLKSFRVNLCCLKDKIMPETSCMNRSLPARDAEDETKKMKQIRQNLKRALESHYYVRHLIITSDTEGKDSWPEASTENSTREEYALNTLRSSSQERYAILEWLSPINFALRHRRYQERRHQGSCQWLLDAPEFKTWVESRRHTLFCPGIPGAGKTIFASVVVEYLQTLHQRDDGIAVSYIFFDFDQQREQEVGILPSLLKQLVQKLDVLPEAVITLYKTHNDLRTQPATKEIIQCLRSILTRYRKIFVVLDALDEAEYCSLKEPLSELVKLQSSSECIMNILATSRFTSETLEMLEQSAELEIRANQEDVWRYLADHTSLRREPLSTSNLPEDFENRVISCGMFLLVAQSVFFLSTIPQKPPAREKRVLAQDFAGYKACDDAFNNIIDRVFRNQPEEWKEIALRTIHWITYSKQDLTLSEVEHARAIEIDIQSLGEDKDEIPSIETIISRFGGFLRVDQDTGSISFAHCTFREHFERALKKHVPDAKVIHRQTPLWWAAASGQTDAVGLLLKARTIFLNCTDQKGYTPLWYAFMNGHGAIMAQLLTNGANADLRDRDGRSVLSRAAEKGQSRVVKLLVSTKGANPDPKDVGGWTPLSHATKNGHMEVVNLLLATKRIDLRWHGSDGRSLLFLAFQNNHEGILRLLLERDCQDADPEILSWATENEKWPIVKLLLEHNDYSNLGDDVAGTVLSLAIEKGQQKVVNLMLRRDSSLANRKDRSGQYPLLLAMEMGHGQIVDLLIKHKADATVMDDSGQTLFSKAATKRAQQVLERLISCDEVDVDVPVADGRTLLSIMAGDGNLKMVEQLLNRSDVDKDRPDNHGRSPLSWAAGEDKLDVVDLLLSRGSAVNAQDAKMWTPLIWATEGSHKTIVESLLHAEADASARDNLGRTALHHAAAKGSIKMARVLKRHTDADMTDSIGNTALMSALEAEHLEVVRELVGTDTVSLHILTKQRRSDHIRALLEKGYDVNIRDSRNGTALHEAVRSQSTTALAELLSAGASMNLTDIDGNTALHLAVDLCCTTPQDWTIDRSYHELIEELLRNQADTKGITVKEWCDAYRMTNKDILISEVPNKGYTILDYPQSDVTRRPKWPPIHEVTGRQLFLVANADICSENTSPSIHAALKCQRQGTSTYAIEARFFTGSGIDNGDIVKTWKCTIGWIVSSYRDTQNRQRWKTTYHLSMLPHGWLPKDGVDFFEQFVSHLENAWLELCRRANDRLSKLRRDVLSKKGQDRNLIDALLEYAQLWAELRQDLGHQVEEANRFVRGYCSRFHHGSNTGLQHVVKDFEDTVAEKIDRLDEASQSLIQIEFNLVSISEARMSTSISTSLKRLSWITFVFLPVMFVSSLFGMNVDVLANNPDWRWFMLFGGAALLLTLMSWLLHKYGNIEKRLERSAEGVRHRWNMSNGSWKQLRKSRKRSTESRSHPV